MHKKKPKKRQFYSDANDKYKRSYDILDELVKSIERVDSHPLQHSAKEYREALEALGNECIFFMKLLKNMKSS